MVNQHMETHEIRRRLFAPMLYNQQNFLRPLKLFGYPKAFVYKLRLSLQRFYPLEKLMKETPERALQYAVKGMMPRNPLGRKMYSKLRVFAGPEHSHEAQQPIPLDIKA